MEYVDTFKSQIANNCNIQSTRFLKSTARKMITWLWQFTCTFSGCILLSFFLILKALEAFVNR